MPNKMALNDTLDVVLKHLAQSCNTDCESSHHERNIESSPQHIPDLWKFRSFQWLHETDSFISIFASRSLEGVQSV